MRLEHDDLTSRGEREMNVMDLYPAQEIVLYGGGTKVTVRPHPFEPNCFVTRVFTKVAGSFTPHWRELNQRNHSVPVRSALRIYHDIHHGGAP